MLSDKMRRKADAPIEKPVDSDLLSEQIKEFVRSGGKITKEPMGKTAIHNYRLSKDNKRAMGQGNL